jgi:8-oxo-dGTP pyrophosphatase MutT (NUDIX family)
VKFKSTEKPLILFSFSGEIGFMELRILSSGVVVVRKTPQGYLYLLLRAYNYWDFPKGLVEKEEDPLEAARREVKEETGIESLQFHWGTVSTETEPYGKGKVARYYLAESSQTEVKLEKGPELGRPEHHEFRWLDFEGARKLLVPRVEKVLTWARLILEKKD